MPPKASLETRKKIYKSLCYVLSDRSNQVSWDEFTPADWDLFSQMADREGVAPLMYWKLKDSPVGVPPSTFNPLHSTYYQTLAQNTLMYQELERILNVLDDAGIPAVVLKGAALAATVYEDIGLRPMGDLDLLVREGDVDRGLEALQQIGYSRFYQHITSFLDSRLVHHINLRSGSQSRVYLELHWSLIAGEADWRAPSMLWFWNQVETGLFPNLTHSDFKDLEGCNGDPQNSLHLHSFSKLSTIAHLLYLTAHIMLQHGANEARLLWFYDLHLLVAYSTQSMNWDELLAHASDHQWSPALYSALVRLGQLFDTVLPEPYINSLSRGQVFFPETSRVIQRKMSQMQTVALNDWERLLTLNSYGRIKYALALVFPGSRYIKWRYQPEPSWLWPFYFPYRWLRMMQVALVTIMKMVFHDGSQRRSE